MGNVDTYVGKTLKTQCTVKGIPTMVLIDTGAKSMAIMSKTLCKELKLKPYRKNIQTNLYAANGGKLDSEGVVGIKLQFVCGARV